MQIKERTLLPLFTRKKYIEHFPPKMNGNKTVLITDMNHYFQGPEK
jgi:hypothetical protein